MARWLYRCEFAQLLDAIPTSDPTYAAFRASCDDADAFLVAQWLSVTGWHISPRDINEHRRRECGCPE